MHVYLIRHGKTVEQSEGKETTSESVLSNEGIRQAELLAQRLRGLAFDHLIASPYPRARKTAEIINTYHRKEIEENDLFVEIRHPSVIQGKPKDDPEVIAIRDEIAAHSLDQNWRHSDEETMHELRNRASSALEYLQSLPYEKVVVSLHGEFLRMLVSVMHHGPEVPIELVLSFRSFAPTQHTGVTMCHFGNMGRSPEPRWHLLTWNDHSHLF